MTTHVNINKRESELKVIVLSKRLIKHTMKLTNSRDRYPKKVRFTLVDPMQKTAIEIYKLLLKANYLRTDNRFQFEKRQDTQSEAVYLCDILLLYIELSLDEKYIDDRSCEYWTRMVSEVKKMALCWKKSDSVKFGS